MKKNLWGFFALTLAISASILQSYSFKPKLNKEGDQSTYNWYPVNSSNQISSTTAKYTSKTKADAIAVDPCDDFVLPNCLYGTNSGVTLGQDISQAPDEQRIRRTN